MDFGSLDAALAQVQQATSGAALEAVLRSACQPMLEQAKRNAPVKTGAVRDHIQLITRHTEHAATAVVEVADSGRGGQQHEAVFAEFGTAREAAKPFMRPAFENNKRDVLSAVEQHLSNALRN